MYVCIAIALILLKRLNNFITYNPQSPKFVYPLTGVVCF